MEVPVPPAITLCPSCGRSVPQDFSFCPNCGKQIREAPLSVSLAAQIGIYAISVLLPPLGLWPGIKYYRHSDPAAKRIGTIAIVVTVISTVATLWLTFAFLNVYLNTLNQSLNGLGG